MNRYFWTHCFRCSPRISPEERDVATTALIQAIRDASLDDVKQALRAGADANAVFFDKSKYYSGPVTSVTIACIVGRADILAYLLKNGASLNVHLFNEHTLPPFDKRTYSVSFYCALRHEHVDVLYCIMQQIGVCRDTRADDFMDIMRKCLVYAAKEELPLLDRVIGWLRATDYIFDSLGVHYIVDALHEGGEKSVRYIVPFVAKRFGSHEVAYDFIALLRTDAMIKRVLACYLTHCTKPPNDVRSWLLSRAISRKRDGCGCCSN